VSLYKKITLPLVALALVLNSCSGESRPRLSMFIGVDISGSFVNGKYFDDSLNFLATYIYGHLNGLGNLEEPNVLFVGAIGGARADEPKTFYPKQTFEGKSVEEIEALLHKIFPSNTLNPYTDFNAFFQQVALTVKNKNLVLKPVSIVMVSDGIPDIKKNGKTDFRSLDVKPLERLSRNVTLRLLYTNAVVGMQWQTEVPRKRVKIWTQDDKVMETWKDPDIFLPDSTLMDQPKYFAWVLDNVDFGVRARRVD
jgi:hypothetical protein